MDDIDIAICEILQQDARISFSELGRRVGLSQPAASERVKRLEDRRIIVGYGARIDPKAVGLPISAYLRIRTTHDRIKDALSLFSRTPEVLEVSRITGEDCFLVRVSAAAPEGLESVVDSLGALGQVTTCLVLRSAPPKPIAKRLIRRRAG